MTEPSAALKVAYKEDDEISLFALGSVLLRWRRWIVVLGLSGAALGLVFGLLSHRVYVSTATFIPQSSETDATSALSLAARQIGIGVPSSGGVWSPAVYVELLRSHALLEPVALDTVVVAEDAHRRVALMDLLKIKAQTPELRVDRAVRALGELVSVNEDRAVDAVNLSVTTQWPSVSLALARQLLIGVNQFNLETRKSQAIAEREFVEAQAADAERALRDAEDRLEAFLERNRNYSGSPELGLARDRLQRDVTMRQTLYTTLAQNLEQAKIREVRDTPVITILDKPRLPVISESRRLLLKLVGGGAGGLILGVLIAFLGNALNGMRRDQSMAAVEFFGLAREVLPAFLRRKRKAGASTSS